MQVPAETFEVEKFDEPMQNLTIDLIRGLGITKLVIGFSFMRPSMYSFYLYFYELNMILASVIFSFVYRKSKDAMNGLFYVHQHKPDFCELFIICGGKQVSPRVKNDEITMEDDSGVKVAKMRDYKTNFKYWIERIFCDKTIDSNQGCSSRSSTSSESHIDQNEWELYIREIDSYFQELLSLNMEEGICGQDNDDSYFSPIEPFVQQLKNSDNKVIRTRTMILFSSSMLLSHYTYWPYLVPIQSGAEKFKILRDKLKEAYDTIQVKRKEEKENLERHAKAEWAIYVSNLRVIILNSDSIERLSDSAEGRTLSLGCKFIDGSIERLSTAREDVELLN